MSTPDKRRISSLEEKRLTHHYQTIKKNIDLSSGELMDKLVELGFDTDDKDEIMKETHRQRQIDLLLNYLKFRDNGFRMLVAGLRESGSGYLADLLQSDVDEFSKSTQTSPTLYHRDNSYHPEQTTECPSTSETELSLDDTDNSMLNTATTTKNSLTQKDTPHLSSGHSQKLDKDEWSESVSMYTKESDDMKQRSTSGSCIQDKSSLLHVALQNPVRLDGFSGGDLDLGQLDEFSTLFKEKGWYAGISDQNITVAVEQARLQHGSYILWYSHKYKTIVVTIIDKDSRKGRVHFLMLKTQDETSTVYYFDERVQCRTPIEALNAVKRKGLPIRVKNVSNYYK